MNSPDAVSDDEAEILLSHEEMMVAIGEICQLMKEAKLEEALEGASMLVEMLPDKPKLQADLGGILFRMGEYDSAELHASIAVDLDPVNRYQQFERVTLQLTAMCEQSHDMAAVGKKAKRRTVASAMAKVAELEATANCGLEIHQDGAGAILQSSPESVHEPLLITSKRQVLPLSWSKACRRPGSPSMAQMSTAYALKKAGDAAYHNKLYPDALKIHNQCIQISPGNAVLLNNRASVHLRLGRWDDAIAGSDAALHVVPRPNGLNVSQAHCRLAKAWQAKGEIAVGLAVVQSQLQQDPAHQALNTLQAELSRLLAAQSPESIDAPTDDLHQPADKPTGDPDSAPLTEAATKASAKVKAGSARCGSGSSMSPQEKSGGPPCISNKNASAASARSGFASTSSNVELDVDEFMQTYFGKPPQAKPINSATADPQQHW
ncbi:hypothetical protein WJX82_004292 [Trebouxia sp. C0006]